VSNGTSDDVDVIKISISATFGRSHCSNGIERPPQSRTGALRHAPGTIAHGANPPRRATPARETVRSLFHRRRAQNLAALKIAENFLGKIDSHRADGNCARVISV